jgi:hypothetical protein
MTPPMSEKMTMGRMRARPMPPRAMGWSVISRMCQAGPGLHLGTSDRDHPQPQEAEAAVEPGRRDAQVMDQHITFPVNVDGLTGQVKLSLHKHQPSNIIGRLANLGYPSHLRNMASSWRAGRGHLGLDHPGGTARMLYSASSRQQRQLISPILLRPKRVAQSCARPAMEAMLTDAPPPARASPAPQIGW